ncbi:MAG TPA: hypothetical protein ENI80_08130 [Acidiferrobacteraceae bacterium]|nr:hypothetical protein [Acidiferrobacteraceae bacterium]
MKPPSARGTITSPLYRMVKKVLHVADERKKTSLKSYYDTLSDTQKAEIESISMDE